MSGRQRDHQPPAVGMQSQRRCPPIIALNKSQIGPSNKVEVLVPKTAKSVAGKAFFECTRIFRVEIKEGVGSIGHKAFEGCTNMTSIIIPPSVTSIGSHAFKDCRMLRSITLPPLAKIAEGTFMKCSNLKSVTFASSTPTSMSLPSPSSSSSQGSCKELVKLTSIKGQAFACCSRLESIELPNSLKTIGIHAFVGCTSLTYVKIPPSLTGLGAFSFRDCTNVLAVDVPPSINGSTFERAFSSKEYSLRLIVASANACEQLKRCCQRSSKFPFYHTQLMTSSRKTQLLALKTKFWSQHSHPYLLPPRRAVIEMILLISNRLNQQPQPRLVSSHRNVARFGTTLSSLPYEIWIMILNCLQHVEIGLGGFMCLFKTKSIG